MTPIVYLASASPRRKELITQLNKKVVICPQNVDERSDKKRPSAIVCNLAKIKLGNLPLEQEQNFVISADTIVWHKGKMLGKPKDKEQAIAFLNELSNEWHYVYTGVSVSYKSKNTTFYCKSAVKFNKLTQDVIEQYVSTGSPMDKAGAYGIQDSDLVAEYKGSYSNIVGLPIEELQKVVAQMEEK